MQLKQDESKKNKFIMAGFLLSMIPFMMFIYNAEDNFRKAKIKEVARSRRERLDREHDIDRKTISEGYKKLDSIYRLSEKEEINKYEQVGKSAQ